MPDLLAGSKIKALDSPPTVFAQDGTSISNITDVTYVPGTPEVGVTFTAPTTGRVKISVGGGLRNNAANSDRVGLAPQVFEDDTSGLEVLVPTVLRGVSSEGIATAGDFAYRGHTTLLDGLTPGQEYYARVMHIKFGTAGTTVDISARDILVAPAS
ncbi:hypothetical protein ACFWBR_42265 [Streptomyces sp. NPDC060006]|uniref:hypothetical protein n=1 Tax=unclassified Streptomyces TaxID=2593676 RepID=UPI0036A9ED43